jgi:lipopolysaccharide export system protein LptA
MPVQIPRLRRWLLLAAVVLSLIVAGAYIRRRSQARDVLKHIPGKMNLDIQQTAEGFKVSKSEEGRTLFTIQASKAVQFKRGGRAELHNVKITLYGRDASRYDQIYGDDFAYDPQTGDITAKGEVRIDLEANPEGLLNPDQSKPSEMKNPIHLVTRDLVFNQKTGNAVTPAKVELRMPQAAGSAVGVHYTAKNNVLRLDSQLELAMTNSANTRLRADRGVITKQPRQVVLDAPHATHGTQRLSARKAILFLRDDNTVDHVIASDDVEAETAGSSPTRAHASQAEFTVNSAQDGLSHAVFSGDVQVESTGPRARRVNAGRVLVEFAGRNQVSKIRADNNVKLVELGGNADNPQGTANSQQVEVIAPAIDFFMGKHQHLARAETSSGGRIVVLPSKGEGSATTLAAARFEARFDDQSRLSSIHGAPDAKIVNASAGESDRISTSKSIDISMLPSGGIDSIVQQGDVAYHDGERQAHAERARYTPADQMLSLTGSPSITDKGLVTTARLLRMNRTTGDAFAEGNVKSTYSSLNEQPNGALLAAASPIHVTAQNMTLRRSSAIATYAGDARIWQDANVVEAPVLEFDRDHRSIVAQGNGKPVSTVLVQLDKHGKVTPIAIASARLTYTDDQHRAHFEGGVTARGADATITADHLDAFLVPHGHGSQNTAAKGPGQLERIVAEGNVSIQEPARRATGDRLTYTTADDRFVLTGGSPSIFDAEHGKITGDSLTFFRRDDRVLVEGKDNSPTVTQTRVAR